MNSTRQLDPPPRSTESNRKPVPMAQWAMAACFAILTGCATGGASHGTVKYVPPAAELPSPKEEPRIVTPGPFGAPPSAKDLAAFNKAGGYWLGVSHRPSDAVVLFDGSSLSKWSAMDGKQTKWVLRDGTMESVKGAGYIRTKDEFQDFQLHIEWQTPSKVEGNGQGRGNSGVFMHGKYELQVLDSYDNKTYFHGQAGAIYKQSAPKVNCSRPPGEWQTYDVVFHGPRYDKSNKLTKPAFITVLHNGILVQDNFMVLGGTSNKGAARYEPGLVKGPLALQDHGNPVHFRNVWIRKL